MVQTAKKGKGRAKAGAHAKNILIEKNENAMTPEAKGSRKRTRKGQEAATGKRARSGDDSEFADLQKKYEFLLSVRETEVEAENAKLVAQLSKMEKGYEQALAALEGEVKTLRECKGVSIGHESRASTDDGPLLSWYKSVTGVSMVTEENGSVSCAVGEAGDMAFTLHVNDGEEMEYTPTNIDESLQDHLPDFLVEEISFAVEEAPMFLAKVLVAVKRAQARRG